MTDLRDYQQAAANAVVHRLKEVDSTYIELPTGSGKTVIMAALTKRALLKGRVLAVAHRDVLVTQLAERLPATGIVKAQQNDVGASVIASSIQSLASGDRMEQCFSGPEPIFLVLIDECHHVTEDNTYGRLLQVARSHGAKILGVTATPWRADGTDSEDVLGRCAFTRSILDMQQEGWLVPFRWDAVQIPGLDLRKIPIVAGDYEKGALSETMLAAVDAVAVTTSPMLEGRTTAVYCATVAHAQAMADRFCMAGRSAMAVWGAMPKADRDWTLDAWRAGAVQIVCNVGVLTEGFDLPSIACVVIARPTRSVGLYVQMIGRSTRLAENKTDSLILDVTGSRNLADPDQVILPDIDGIHCETDPDAEPRQAVLRKMGTNGDHRERWVWRRVKRYVYAPIAGDSYIVLAPMDSSGLVRGCVISKDGAVVQITDDAYTPRRATIEISKLFRSREHKQFSVTSASWRKDEATPKQLGLLAKLAPSVHQQAVAESWSKGQVAAAINDVFAGRAIAKAGV